MGGKRYSTEQIIVKLRQAEIEMRRLICGRLTFTPRDRHCEFSGVGTVEPVLGGLVQKLVSPTGTTWNPLIAQLTAFETLKNAHF